MHKFVLIFCIFMSIFLGGCQSRTAIKPGEVAIGTKDVTGGQGQSTTRTYKITITPKDTRSKK